MYTVYQLMQKINTEYPNNGFVYGDEVKYNTEDNKIEQGFIDYLNGALNRVSKYIMLDDIYEFPTIKGQAIYELPINCKLENISEVTREYGKDINVRLRWARDAEFLDGNRYFNAYGNMIGLSPVPAKDGEKITIFFKRTPRPVKTKDDPVEVKDEYIDLLVYSVVADLASSGSNPDIEIANNYTLKYNTLLQEAITRRYNEQPFYPKTKDNKRPPLAFIRRGR